MKLHLGNYANVGWLVLWGGVAGRLLASFGSERFWFKWGQLQNEWRPIPGMRIVFILGVYLDIYFNGYITCMIKYLFKYKQSANSG